MNLSKTLSWLILAAFLVLGIVFVAARKQPVKEASPATVGLDLGPEGKLDIAVSWDGIPPGILFRAERSDWDTYARGERSIVVYDFRAELMVSEQAVAAIQLELNLVNPMRQSMKTHVLEIEIDSLYAAGELISLHWRWQDTLLNPTSPQQLMVQNMGIKMGRSLNELKDRFPIPSTWLGEKPKQLGLRFETRYLDYIDSDKKDPRLFYMVFATTNTGALPIEFLKLRIDAYAQSDSLLFSMEKEAVGNYEPPLRVDYTRLNRLVTNIDRGEFQIKDIDRIEITILEADY